ncbi:MAG TPA: hypothetical protein PKK56_00365 [archaeon]|nr:hypothetical protein [archaeon]
MGKDKGQVMVLDILFSITLLILMIFLLSKITELQIDKENTEKEIYKLNKIGNIVYNKLTNNQEINCYTHDNNNDILIPNCFGKDSIITKQALGLTSDYNCNFSITNFTITNNQCNQTYNLSDLKAYYIVDINVIVNNTRDLNKQTVMNNILNKTNDLNIETGTIVIWK